MSRQTNFISNEPLQRNVSNMDNIEYKSKLCENKRSVLFWGSCFLLIYVVTFPMDSDDSTYVARLVLHVIGILLSLGFMFAVYQLRFEYGLIFTVGLVIQTSLTLSFMPSNGYQSMINASRSVLIGLTCLVLVMSVLYMFINVGFYMHYSPRRSFMESLSSEDELDVCRLNDPSPIANVPKFKVSDVFIQPRTVRNSRNSRDVRSSQSLQLSRDSRTIKKIPNGSRSRLRGTYRRTFSTPLIRK